MNDESRWLPGVILSFQERRFALGAADGTTHLFILTHDAPVDGDSILRWQRCGTRVIVECTTLPGTIAWAAADVKKAPAGDLGFESTSDVMETQHG